MTAGRPGERYQRVAGVLERRTLDGVLLLGPAHPEVVALLGPAEAIWDHLATPLTEEALVTALTRDFDADEPTIGPDVARTLDDLVTRSLVTRTPV